MDSPGPWKAVPPRRKRGKASATAGKKIVLLNFPTTDGYTPPPSGKPRRSRDVIKKAASAARES
jgi:hypothetical protein